MGDWTQTQEHNLAVISSFSLEAVGVQCNSDGRSLGNAVAWPVSNLAIYVPFQVLTPSTAQKMSTANQTSQSGNLDVGIYDDQGNRLVSKGSTAGSGINQEFDITDTLLLPGSYYMALAVDNTTHVVGAAAPIAAVAGSWGVLQQASAFPLPSTATFAAMAQAYVPVMAVHLRALV